MNVIFPSFQLIGSRTYIHSTTILGFLDGINEVENGPIELRIRSQVLPGVEVHVCESCLPKLHSTARCAASARIEGKYIYFLNPSDSQKAENAPDKFEEMAAHISHRAGQTSLRTTSHGFWERAIYALKCQLAIKEKEILDHDIPTSFFLGRIKCLRGEDTDQLKIRTKIQIDGSWSRMEIFAGTRKVGEADGALKVG